MDKLKTYYQLYAKTGKIGKFKENFNKGRRCPICKKTFHFFPFHFS